MFVTFELVDRASLPDEEAAHAAVYWSGIGVRPWYAQAQHWRRFIAKKVLSFSPESVFEFGCNAGANLTLLREYAPTLRSHGVDVNAEAVAYGRKNGLDLEVGNETYLASLPDKAFDVSFTVSVLDHVPAPEIALAQLLRINSKAVLLLEPWIGREGKLVRSPTPHGEMTDSTPYSYSWDYARLANQLAPDWALQHEPYPLGDSCLGQHYFMYRLTPGARSPAGRPDIEPRV